MTENALALCRSREAEAIRLMHAAPTEGARAAHSAVAVACRAVITIGDDVTAQPGLVLVGAVRGRAAAGAIVESLFGATHDADLAILRQDVGRTTDDTC